jgi:hypothetical protein
VRWRERHVDGLAPLPSLRRVPKWLALCLTAAATITSALLILFWYLHPARSLVDIGRALLSFDLFGVADLVPGAEEGFLIQVAIVMLLASLVVGIRCSGTITGERERKTWESLLLTPLTARELVGGKLWGVMGASHDYVLVYAASALPLAALAGPLALLYTLLGLGITVLAMYFVGTAGLWCSVKAKNSWRSLLSTMGLSYVTAALAYVLTTPVIGIIATMLVFLLYVVDASLGTNMATTASRGMWWSVPVFFVASCIGLALALIWLARQFLSWTQRWIADRDRTRHWKEEPVYRRRRRAGTSYNAAH